MVNPPLGISMNCLPETGSSLTLTRGTLKLAAGPDDVEVSDGLDERVPSNVVPVGSRLRIRIRELNLRFRVRRRHPILK